MNTWCKTGNTQRYGVAVYNFNKHLEGGLKLDIGDTVCILEDTEDWYRGYLLKNRQQSGIFPKSYVCVKEAIVKHSGSLETVIPKEPPIASEITSVLREWGAIWKELYVDQSTLFHSIQNMMLELIAWRRKIMSRKLSASVDIGRPFFDRTNTLPLPRVQTSARGQSGLMSTPDTRDNGSTPFEERPGVCCCHDCNDNKGGKAALLTVLNKGGSRLRDKPPTGSPIPTEQKEKPEKMVEVSRQPVAVGMLVVSIGRKVAVNGYSYQYGKRYTTVIEEGLKCTPVAGCDQHIHDPDHLCQSLLAKRRSKFNSSSYDRDTLALPLDHTRPEDRTSPPCSGTPTPLPHYHPLPSPPVIPTSANCPGYYSSVLIRRALPARVSPSAKPV
ncbi:hypothetical protein ScPMuIL_000266 [Solemya velum]